MEQKVIIMLIIVSITVGIGNFLLLAKFIFDMCDQMSKTDMIYKLSKFLTLSYLDDHPEQGEFFEKMIGINNDGKAQQG